MAADIKAIAPVDFGPGQSSDLISLLQHDRRQAMLERFMGSGQAGGAGTDDDNREAITHWNSDYSSLSIREVWPGRDGDADLLNFSQR